MKDYKGIVVGIACIGIPVMFVIIACFAMWHILPHRNKGFIDGPIGFEFTELIHDPYTYSENSPYISDYWANVDTDKKLVLLGFSIGPGADISIPQQHIVLWTDDTSIGVHEAPFEQMNETGNEFDAYIENVKDKSPVYTIAKNKESDSAVLNILCPMEGVFKDPANLSEINVRLQGIFDEDGNEIVSDSCTTDWIIQENLQGRWIPEIPCLNVDMDGMYEMKNGDTVKVYLTIGYDGMVFCDPQELNKEDNYITENLQFEGFKADPKWELEVDENGRERMVLVLSNIEDIDGNRISIYFPSGIASGWDRGLYCTSMEQVRHMNIRETEKNDEKPEDKEYEDDIAYAIVCDNSSLLQTGICTVHG